MYCSTCGARVPEGRANCQACGAVVARVSAAPSAPPSFQAHISFPGASAGPRHAVAGTLLEPVGICPRCGFQGQSVGYFSRGGHVAGLVTLTVITGTFMGAGGILYYMLRREHRICPRCGEGWGKHGAFALTAGPGGTLAPRTPVPVQQVDPLMSSSGGGAKTVFSYMLFAFAALMMIIGVAEFEFVPILFAMMSGGGGALLHRQSRIDREQRREALLEGLQLPVLQLAGKRGGRLTVTDVATEFGWPMQRAEKVLNSLEDGMRVMSDITDDGVIVYDFLEIRAAKLAAAERSDARRTLPGGDGPPQQSAIA